MKTITEYLKSMIALIASVILIPGCMQANQMEGNQERNTTYLVILKDGTTYQQKNEIYSVPDVRFIQETIFGAEQLPAVIISATEAAVEQIKQLEFVLEVRPVIQAPLTMPTVPASP